MATRREALPPASRLRRRRDFERSYRTGRRHHGRLGTLLVTPNREGGPRLGLTVSRKVGGAVVRNRVKRRIREIFRRWRPAHRQLAVDLVVHARPAMAAASWEETARELERLLDKAASEPPRDR